MITSFHRLFILSIVVTAFTQAETKIGVISYWDPTTATTSYDRLPDNSLALINPQNGIFVGQTNELVANVAIYQEIVRKAAERSVTMLGYVPTGYFNHDCNRGGECQTMARIEAQIKAYYDNFPGIGGIFFDEATMPIWDCNGFTVEYENLRRLVAKYAQLSATNIAYNAGVPDNCVVNGVKEGEILALFENSMATYEATNVNVSTKTARNKGVITWHLLHSVPQAKLSEVVSLGLSYKVDYFYATNIGGDWQNGDNTWGSLPMYWNTLVELLAPMTTTTAATPPTVDATTNSADRTRLGLLHLMSLFERWTTFLRGIASTL